MKKLAIVFSILFLIFCCYFIYNINRSEFSLFPNQKKKIFFAHRGLPYFTENSDESFRESKLVGFSALETDVQFTKDHKLIVFHDKNAQRLLGIDAEIEDCNWNDLKDLPIMNNGVESLNNILTLQQLLFNSYGFKMVYLDIKATVSKIMADQLLFQIDRNKGFDTFFIADSNIFFLAYLKYRNSNIKTVLEGYKKGKEWLYYFIPLSLRPDYLSSSYNDIDNNHISFLKKKKLINRKIVYGIDSSNVLDALDRDIQMLIVDYHQSIDSLITLHQ